MIHNLELEQHLLGGLFRHPERYGEIAGFIDPDDFYADDSKMNRTIFMTLRQCLENGEAVDPTVVAERIKDYNITFGKDIAIGEYLYALSLRSVSSDQIKTVAEDLKKYTIRRNIFESAKKVGEKVRKIDPATSYVDIIDQADEIFNSKINFFDNGPDVPVDIFNEMEHFIEERGENPQEDYGLAGPYKRMNELYGSLLRPGNITVFVARSGVGKTRLVLDFCTKVSQEHQVPVLHFDNGEMSREELIVRQCSAVSGVSPYHLETGKWRQMGDDVVEKVREGMKKVKQSNAKLYYYNVGGYTVDKMISTLRRFYYSKVGRGNPMIFSFDYIKTSSESQGSKSEWQIVGEMVDKFKKTIQKEICIDGQPLIPMITSVQSNRSGVVNNRRAENIVDDESIVSLSDRITQFCSHMFILREKTLDEREAEPEFGTHKIIKIKARHLGKLAKRAIDPVRMQDGSMKQNVIHFNMNGFQIEEIGDQVDLVEAQGADWEMNEQNENNGAPDFRIR